MKNSCFTLSEVLLTLGIVGVIAAMVMPTLNAHIQGVSNATKFKKALSTLSAAARLSYANYDFDFSGINTKCNADSVNDKPWEVYSICALFNGSLSGAKYYWGLSDLNEKFKYEIDSPYAKQTYSFGYSANPTKKLPVYVLQDGTILILSSSIGTQSCTGGTRDEAFYNRDENGVARSGTACYGLIDVNGISKPNKEIECSSGKNYYSTFSNGKERTFNCKIKMRDISDIFLVVFHDGIVEPASDAGWAALHNIK